MANPALFLVRMDVAHDHDKKFNEVYDTEHVPMLLKVPGVLSATRTTTEPLAVVIGGQRKVSVMEGEPRYTAIFELENADVLVSDAWAKTVDQGRWRDEIRPYVSNRRHTLKRVI